MVYQAILLLPLLGALLAGLLGKRINDHAAEYIATICLCFSALLSLYVFFFELPHLEAAKLVPLFQFLDSGTLQVDWAIRIDALTAVMLVVVTGVSSLVHVYSIGYMHHDPHRPRFFAYLSLFTFAMLALVTADNFVQMFFGWEGVGLCSYLLIGFWYKKPSANAAAIKAFIVNRVGDFGFALGIMAIFFVFGSLDFTTVFDAAKGFAGKTFSFAGQDVDILTTICLLLFMGAMGKSAQFMLHTWLPDAMEGPTPVSALIHAATMVTAGVFLVCRCSPLFELAPFALEVVTVIGATTAFFAATVGLFQNDIKRVIAYSTCSQLGYMFFAAGVGAYKAAMFHLFTHAFFKALLFLGAGSVIHALNDEQDMRKMGGVAKMIPATWALMVIGTLALTGFPFMAGFWSKDAIIESAYAAHSSVGMYAFALGIVAAGMTSFYSWRLIFMTFHGRYRGDPHDLDHIHDSPPVMLIPLVILAAGAVLAGILFEGSFIGHEQMEFWRGAIVNVHEHTALEARHHVPDWVIFSPAVVMLLGFVTAWYFYIEHPEWPAQMAAKQGPLYLFFYNKWYFDELYDFLFVRPAKRLGHFLWKTGDGKIIDGLGPDGVSAGIVDWTKQIVRLQSGFVYHYAFAMLIGVALLATWFTAGGAR
ncbi:MAG: NADH-quinone oxidoreductase subunit L [Alphaproteobacteria bacterium]|nr:NADH-quinone oxidoreductase subunit L [Alphaproteobacteria bacterium]